MSIGLRDPFIENQRHIGDFRSEKALREFLCPDIPGNKVRGLHNLNPELPLVEAVERFIRLQILIKPLECQPLEIVSPQIKLIDPLKFAVFIDLVTVWILFLIFASRK